MSGPYVHGQRRRAANSTADKLYRQDDKATVAAIFIHAGAGYHSTANEKVHLEACSDAAQVAMGFLRTGATATEAVEAAIKSLEDKEITNAGYGSNLNMDGVVECDATIVDHMGRSGACGAVPNVKNPISLAKLILETSRKPLSLRRVPPNILVGDGARDFARTHGMRTIDNELLISKNAKDRYIRWTQDLKRAETGAATPSSPSIRAGGETAPMDYEMAAADPDVAHRRDHLNAILTATWNEGQPDSPHSPSPAPEPQRGSPGATAAPRLASPHSLPPRPAKSPLSFMHALRPSSSSQKRPSAPLRHTDSQHRTISSGTSLRGNQMPDEPDHHDSSVSPEDIIGHGHDGVPRTGGLSDSMGETGSDVGPAHQAESERSLEDHMDLVTDTVGAIAIDSMGNIAAGSSSGGIGMKHSGRIGPAALVGIGTAVIPEDPDDGDLVSIAVVTSGTGEHMATTLASFKCAERLRHSTRRGLGGNNVEEFDDDSVMQSFITDDFMAHPGVRSQASQGAIGVMAVKKTRGGYYFYFAHNTDSFALASMASHEREPLCVMSRLGEVSEVARGGRKIRLS